MTFKKIACTAAFSAVALFSQPTLAADIVINLGHAASETSPNTLLASKFEELAEKYSNGSIDVKVRCCTQLSTEDEAFKAMQLGTVDMYIISFNNISPHFPLMDVFVLPYIFQDKAHAYGVLEGPIGADFASKLQQATGVHLLTYGFVGDRDFYNSRGPITSVDDMVGLKVRVPKNQVMIDTYDAFGAAPIPLPWADTATALQTGTVSGGDLGTGYIKSQKFYEMMPHFTALEHFVYFTPLFASNRLMAKLDDSQREAIMRAAKEAGAYHKEQNTATVDSIRAWLTDEGGMQTVEFDRTGFIAAGQTVQDSYAAEKDEEFNTLLRTIRAAAE
jgi:tripartite ATP-independent transporter DctP family solute receptor